MTAKIEGNEQHSYLKGIQKKISCSKHHQQLVLKCEHAGCESPYICWDIKCLLLHKHEGYIKVNEFRTEQISHKFMEIDNLICDDTVYQNAKTLKIYIEGLKQSIKNVYIGIKSINQSYDHLKGDLEGPLTSQYISKVDQTYAENQRIRNKIQEIKAKVKLEFSVKDSYFEGRCQLIEFLNDNIKGLNWSKSQEIYSSKSELISCQKFHEKLSGMEDLIFIYIGENKMLGSYFQKSYPSLSEKSIKDQSSFLFLSEKKEGNINKIYKFQAISEADSHMTVDSKNYICQGNTVSYGDGIRTFHKNFENIQYSLPSTTFQSEESSDESFHLTFNGTLKPRRFMILKAHIERNRVQNVDENIVEDNLLEIGNDSSPNGVVEQNGDTGVILSVEGN